MFPFDDVIMFVIFGAYALFFLMLAITADPSNIAGVSLKFVTKTVATWKSNKSYWQYIECYMMNHDTFDYLSI